MYGHVQQNKLSQSILHHSKGVEAMSIESYIQGDRKSGIFPGDFVLVTRSASDWEGGWKNTWPSSMNDFVG